jgi:hypothetical protein
MPEISRFLGIVIQMYFNDHTPPHFHAKYGEHQASIVIESLGLLEGRLPGRILSLVVEWGMEHRDELTANWESLRSTGQCRKIRPLV